MLESVISRDTGSVAELYASVSRGHLERLCIALHGEKGPVGVVAGTLPAGIPNIATDRLLASATLAWGLNAVGREVVLISDHHDEPALRATVMMLDAAHAVTEITYVPAKRACRGPLRETLAGLGQAIFVDRIGPNSHGQYVGAGAGALNSVGAPLEEIASFSGIRTAGIIADKTKIGAGNLRGRTVAGGTEGACIVAVDDLIVSPIASWAAWAILAGLAILDTSLIDRLALVMREQLYVALLRGIAPDAVLEGLFAPEVYPSVLEAMKEIAGIGEGAGRDVALEDEP